MKKITEIPITRYRTIEEKSASGKRTRRQVPYTAMRDVTVTSDGKRLLHFFIDAIVFQLVAFALNFAWESAFIPYVDSSEPGSIRVILFSINGLTLFVTGGYYILFEYFLGKTPGKFITRTRVINIYGKKPTLDALMIRTLSRFIPFEAFSCIGGRGWHDKFSETYVVDDTEAAAIVDLLNEAGQQPARA